MSTDSNDATLLLGPLVQEHKTRKSLLFGLFLFGGLLLAFGLLLAGRAIFDLLKGSDNAVALGVASPLFLVGGAGLLIWAILRLPQRAAVHQGGLYVRDRRGEWAVPWDMIDGVYQKILRVYRAEIEVDVRDVYTIVLRDGTRLVVDYHFEQVESFGATLSHQMDRLLLPAYRQAFLSGQAISFGPVAIDRHGVHANGKSLPWGEVEGFSWKQGILASDRAFLQIKRTGGLLAWAKIPIEQIKNYTVLMSLASEMTRIS